MVAKIHALWAWLRGPPAVAAGPRRPVCCDRRTKPVKQKIPRIGGWLYRRAENVLAAKLAAMFAAFLLQIAFRYLLNLPIGWTSEVSAILWIWMVLWGAALVLREEEEIRFDLVSAVAGERVRSVMFLVAAGELMAIYAVSFPAEIGRAHV